MAKHFKLLVFVMVGMLPVTAWTLETVTVAVLPFEINAVEGKSYLEEQLPRVIAAFLTQEGAQVADIPIPEGASWQSLSREAGGVQKLGMTHGADYIIRGSLTRIDQMISIDAKMIASTGQEPVSTFFVEGKGIENLSNMVQELVRRFGLKLFKRVRVARIQVAGNKRIEPDAILKVIRTKPGDVFLAKSLSDDLKAVYRMGYFEDIRIRADDGPDGKTITFELTEKPTVRHIAINGNKIFDDEKIKENLTIKRGSILNIHMVQNNLQRIESLYKEKNYHNVKADYKVIPADGAQADLEFTITEGEKVRIKSIVFEGNKAYGNDDLKDLMKTTEKGFWSWITSSGELNQDNLNQDVSRLAAFYHNNGFVDAKIGDPQVKFEEKWIAVTIKIDEGAQYRVGKVAVTGDLIKPEAELLSKLGITRQTFYSREVVRNDVLKLSDLYSDDGYAYANISPRIDKNPGELTVDLTYVTDKGKPVYFEKIIISGNTKTRDKVIRRQLDVKEQGLYSGSKMKRGIRNLHRLDYFEDIKVDTRKGGGDDQMIVKIDVTEKPTGTFSFGGGYSSTENLFAMASISQRNLFGLGQILQLKGEVGGSSNRFTLSFTEPWLFDIPLSAGFDLYNWDREYDTYDRDTAGGAVRFSYPVWDYTRAYLTYRYELSDIRNITEDAAREVKELEGELSTSSITGAIRYDSRDKAFNPTEGGNHALTLEYAGIGGDIGFTKVIAEAGQYFPLFWSTVGFIHAEGGWVQKNSGGILPDYEKFYLGGINSLRGFDWRDVSLLDEDGSQVGGYKYVQFNVEYIVPLIEKAGLVGVVFFDTGNVYDDGENIKWNELRESAGGGVRWYSPMGPIRIEYGFVLDRRDNEEEGRWEFSMGNTF